MHWMQGTLSSRSPALPSSDYAFAFVWHIPPRSSWTLCFQVDGCCIMQTILSAIHRTAAGRRAGCAQVMQCEHYKAVRNADEDLEWALHRPGCHTMLSMQWLDSKVQRRAVQPTVDVARVRPEQLLATSPAAQLPTGPHDAMASRALFDEEMGAPYLDYYDDYQDWEHGRAPRHRGHRKLCFSWRYALVVTARRVCPTVPTLGEMCVKLNARQPAGQPADVAAKRLWRLLQLLLFRRDHPALGESRQLFELLVHGAAALCPRWHVAGVVPLSRAQRLLFVAVRALVLPLPRAWLQRPESERLWQSIADAAPKLADELHNSVLKLVEGAAEEGLPRAAPGLRGCLHSRTACPTSTRWC